MAGGETTWQSDVLDVGCGLIRKEPGAVGIDISGASKPEVVWDLNQYPWPLPSDSFRHIHMSQIIEHLDDAIRAMAEVHRVAKPGADVFVATPHFSSHNSYTDPTHKHHFAAATFRYFAEQRFDTFLSANAGRFELVDVRVTFGGNLILDNVGRWISNLSLKWWERHCAWILPAWDIHAHLRVVK